MGWCGFTSGLDIVKKLKRTLWYLRNKVYDELDQKLDHALINLELALQERGFIPFP